MSSKSKGSDYDKKLLQRVFRDFQSRAALYAFFIYMSFVLTEIMLSKYFDSYFDVSGSKVFAYSLVVGLLLSGYFNSKLILKNGYAGYDIKIKKLDSEK
jgi:hypothetical protein